MNTVLVTVQIFTCVNFNNLHFKIFCQRLDGSAKYLSFQRNIAKNQAVCCKRKYIFQINKE